MKTQTTKTNAQKTAHPKQLFFANNRFRTFKSGWGDVRAEYVGTCPVSGHALYVNTDPEGGNDPRGPLGVHAVSQFVASEYSMKGPTLLVSWIAVNDSRETYERALKLAKSAWEPDPEAEQRAAEQLARANAYHAARG